MTQHLGHRMIHPLGGSVHLGVVRTREFEFDADELVKSFPEDAREQQVSVTHDVPRESM